MAIITSHKLVIIIVTCSRLYGTAATVSWGLFYNAMSHLQTSNLVLYYYTSCSPVFSLYKKPCHNAYNVSVKGCLWCSKENSLLSKIFIELITIFLHFFLNNFCPQSFTTP